MTSENTKPAKHKIKFSINIIGTNDFGETIYSIYFGGISITFDSVSFDSNTLKEDPLVFFHRKVEKHKSFGITTGAIPMKWFDENEIKILSKVKQEVE